MKKYLLILMMVVVALSTSAMAAGHIELRVAPDDVNQAGYQTSETITIQLYATDFYTEPPNDTIGFMDIAAILTDNNGIASAPSLHSELAGGVGASPGTIVNSGGVLISDIAGYMLDGDLDGVTPFPAVLHEFEFHVPDLPLSYFTTISPNTLELRNVGYQTITPAYTEGEPLEIRSPCCPGDTDNDGDIDIYDFSRLRGRLKKAYKCTGEYRIQIWPPDPCDCIRILSSPCLDCEPWGVGDGDVDINDYSKLRGLLKKAYKKAGQYYISCDDPCEGIRDLWPCECP